MMRAIMRLDKSQVGDTVKTSSSRLEFRKKLYLMAGYKTFKAMCVGASGGRAGNANANANNIAYGAGGGGGGSIYIEGNLVDLEDSMQMTPGLAGSTGDNSGNNVVAEDGGSGGTSLFYGSEAGSTFGWFASGGAGGRGNKITTAGVYTAGDSGGGNGGTNSEALGSGGIGGSASGSGSGVAPTSGQWVDGSSSPFVLAGGRGGGGGRGKVILSGDVRYTSDDGASGAETLDDEFRAPIGLIAPNKGGTGGGANIEAVTGEVEYYGSGSNSSVSPTPNQSGVVVVRVF